jgi:hypothetical protein
MTADDRARRFLSGSAVIDRRYRLHAASSGKFILSD